MSKLKSIIYFIPAFFSAVLLFSCSGLTDDTIRIGSKHFNESYILAEIMAQHLEEHGFHVKRNYGLGGTLICYKALTNKAIDLYPEYSGTIEQAILKLEDKVDYQELQQILENKHGLDLLGSFGFNNTYAMAVRTETAERLDLHKISQLREHPNLEYGFSYEFLERSDGWGAMSDAYDLNAQPTGMEHGLAYQALDEGNIDVMDVYTTDAEIDRYDLTLLKDDKDFFPEYLAAPLVRTDFDSTARALLADLAGRLTSDQMQKLNAEVAIHKRGFAEAAQKFLLSEGLTEDRQDRAESLLDKLGPRVVRHILLTGVALLVAMGVAIPGGIFVYKKPTISKPVVYISGLLQTIPSIALLALMIPLFGIGVRPAIIALILYAILPILRNTYVALHSVDPILKKVSIGMGLTSWQRLWHVEIPLAMPSILAGISTAAVIGIGTATLAAFIGAGGLGEPIVTGLALNDPYLIMEGAIPAALLAIIVEYGFRVLEKVLIPKHLLQKQAR